MDAKTQFGNIARSLSPSAKNKVQQVVPRFTLQSRSVSDPKALHRAAIDALRLAFPTASGPQLDVLAFYLIATVAANESDGGSPGASIEPVARQERFQGKLNTRKDLSEPTQLRLQTHSDRRSKLHETLTTMMKKMSETQQSIIQNLK